jgi:hypothetical protein
MKQIIILIVVVFSLSSCQPPPSFQQQCANMGFSPGSQEFSQCTLSLYQQNQANRAAFAAAYLNRPAPAEPQLYMPAAPAHTSCNVLGNNINCSSYR